MTLDTTRVRGLCFDVDGTLNDTDDLWVKSLTQRLAPLSRILSPHSFSRWAVMTFETPMNLVYEILDKLALDDDVERLLKRIEARRQKRTSHNFNLIGHVRETLAVLGARYPMTIVSARDAATTESFLDTFSLRQYFQAVITSQTCPRTKPHPDPILAAARAMGLPPEDCLMIGDTTVDILSARRAGAQAVGVLCGFGHPRELTHAGALHLLNTPDELPGLLGM